MTYEGNLSGGTVEVQRAQRLTGKTTGETTEFGMELWNSGSEEKAAVIAMGSGPLRWEQTVSRCPVNVGQVTGARWAKRATQLGRL